MRRDPGRSVSASRPRPLATWRLDRLELALVQVGLSQVTPATPTGPIIVSVLVIVGFISAVGALMTLNIDFSATSGQAFLVLMGVLSQAFATVVAYWLGSSAGSAAKNATIAALANKQGE